ncbi:MAG: hypothetical protein HFH86_01780 [Bacilli bacterium]|jgi:hypothetical protein|nr:hypothetical protein [Bacilli bacterium]
MIGIFTFVLLIGIIIYQSFAMYEQKMIYNVIQGQVPNLEYDTLISFVIESEDGTQQKVNDLPGKEDYYVLADCTNGAIGTWDYDKWALLIESLSKTRTKCTLYFKPNELTAPTLGSGSNDWIYEYPTISFVEGGNSNNGIEAYEYYVTADKNEIPNEMTLPLGRVKEELILRQDGVQYVYFRTVSKTGKVSSWSNQAEYKVDTKVPVLTMLASGKYEIESEEQIATATFGGSGGSVVCKNGSFGNQSVTTFKAFKVLGTYDYTCVATGQNGKKAELTRTYQIEGTFFPKNGAIKTKPDNPSYTPGAETIVLPPSNVQFGPYIPAKEGCYKVVYTGTGFQTECINVKIYQNSPRIDYERLSLQSTNTSLQYYFQVTPDNVPTSLEFFLGNNCDTNMEIQSVHVSKIDKCPSS